MGGKKARFYSGVEVLSVRLNTAQRKRQTAYPLPEKVRLTPGLTHLKEGADLSLSLSLSLSLYNLEMVRRDLKVKVLVSLSL